MRGTAPYVLDREEWSEILTAARGIDRSFDAEVDYDGPGRLEGTTHDERLLALAIETILGGGCPDQCGGTVEFGLHAARVGRAVLWTDDRGFMSVTVYGSENEAINEVDEEDRRCYGGDDDDD